jgi:hypothetical protein
VVSKLAALAATLCNGQDHFQGEVRDVPGRRQRRTSEVF